MNAESLAATIRDEVAHYQYPAVATVGRAWTPERVEGELALLRAALVPPSRAPVRFGDGAVVDCWVVTREVDGYVVIYDERQGRFELAEGPADAPVSINLAGDVVGVFMAR